jgi:CBS domain containing-hemolysin-like protein
MAVDGHYSLHDFLTYFELDELTNDYEVNTVSGMIMTELSYSKRRRKTNLAEICLRSYRYGWSKD